MLFVHIVHNIKTFQTQLILNCFLLNQCVWTTQKFWLPRNLCSTLCLFGSTLCLFHGFVILVGRIEPTAYFVFYLVIKMWENPYKKPYQIWKTVKAFKKHQNVLTRIHKKRQILFQRFVCEYALFLPIPLILLKGRMKLG